MRMMPEVPHDRLESAVPRRRQALAVMVTAAALAVGLAAPSAATPRTEPEQVRFATFNVSMFRDSEGELAADLADANDEAQDVEVRNVAEIIQRQSPDVLLLNEFDYDADGLALRRFQDNFLGVSQSGQGPVDYPYAMAFPSNTGVPSGLDLDGNGTIGTSGIEYGNDAFGFGTFPGQYAFAVLSRYPIDTAHIRTFQNFLWRDMPGARLPDDPNTPEPRDFYSPEELAVFRLSSKNHVDVPVQVGRRTVHLLASHPTPPVFDGPEDRNGLRNADEIRFWADYIGVPWRSRYIHDDAGHRGGLRPGEAFVIAGDMNADAANDGNGVPGAAQQITRSFWTQDPRPRSAGAAEASELQGGVNAEQQGDPALDTADFSDAPGSSGNLRADYVLPSRFLRVRGAGVFWPERADPLFPLVGTFDPAFTNGFPSSDHRMVWTDAAVPRWGGRH